MSARLHPLHKPLFVALTVLAVLLMAACTATSKPPAAQPADPQNQAEGADQPETAGQQLSAGANKNGNITQSPLPDPAIGLDGLQSYRATLDITVSGTLDGQPYQRQSHLERSFVAAAGDEELLSEIISTGDPDFGEHTLRLGRAIYRLTGDGACQGQALDPRDLEPTEELAARLLPVAAATLLEPEVVNGVASSHYRFTQAGLRIVEQDAQVQGDVWIAEQGGYVLRYELMVAAPAQASPVGLHARQELRYELSQVNQIEGIALPAGCVPVLADFPAMSDAQDLQRGSGTLIYTTTADQPAVIDFYNRQLASLGWEQDGSAPAQDSPMPTILHYRLGSLRAIITLDDQDVIVVQIDLDATATAPLAEEQPNQPEFEPTADFSQTGFPTEVQLYPGATGLQNLAGMGANFKTSDSPEQVAQFYRDRLAPAGWTPTFEGDTGGTLVQTWTKAGKVLSVIITPEQGHTSVTMSIAN